MPPQTNRDIERLRDFARHVGIEETTAVRVYESEVERLREGARIERWITVRAEKHARERLRQMTQEAG